MKIRPLSAETIADYLMQAGHLAEESHILSAYAQGRIGQALELVEDEGFREMRQDILGKLEALPSMSEGEAYLLAKDLEGYKNDLRFLDIMELWYRDLLTAKSLREEGYLIQRDKRMPSFGRRRSLRHFWRRRQLQSEPHECVWHRMQIFG